MIEGIHGDAPVPLELLLIVNAVEEQAAFTGKEGAPAHPVPWAEINLVINKVITRQNRFDVFIKQGCRIVKSKLFHVQTGHKKPWGTLGGREIKSCNGDTKNA